MQSGEQVTAVLAGSWRAVPPAVGMSPAVLTAVVPLLLESGAGGLAWWRLRRSPLQNTRAARDLRQVFREQSLAAAAQEQYLCDAVACLRGAGVEPILIKGWAVGRLYAEPGLRLSADVDLCVPPEQFTTAGAALRGARGMFPQVDLHEGVADAPDRTWDGLFARSRLVPLGDTAIRVLGAEDHLRQLCLHFWRHGAIRPLWLCDIAALLEALPADFDWDYFRSGDRVPTAWCLAFIGLARQLLGARLDNPDVTRRTEDLPRWLTANVLWKWGRGMSRQGFRGHVRHPRQWAGLLRHGWLDPMKVAYRAGVTPDCPAPLMPVLGLLQQPVKLGIRTGRIATTRFRRLWPDKAVRHLNVHPQAASRYL